MIEWKTATFLKRSVRSAPGKKRKTRAKELSVWVSHCNQIVFLSATNLLPFDNLAIDFLDSLSSARSVDFRDQGDLYHEPEEYSIVCRDSGVCHVCHFDLCAERVRCWQRQCDRTTASQSRFRRHSQNQEGRFS